MMTGLPAATILLQDQNLIIADSSFEDLSALGQGSLMLSRCNIIMENANFANNLQSGAGCFPLLSCCSHGD